MDTLVLSAHWEPMYRISWRSAYMKLVTEKAEVLEYYADRTIGWIGGKLPMPSVIRFVGAVRKRYIVSNPDFNRKNVWLRDGGTCAYCTKKVGRHSFTYDHVVPRSRGGQTTWENIVVSCAPCNERKRDRTPKEAGMKLHARPRRPDTLPRHRSESLQQWVYDSGLPEAWANYLPIK